MGSSNPPTMMTTPPRLRYDSLSTKQLQRHLESIGLATPPLRPPGAVPFKWEEVPGKPKLLFGFPMHYHNYKMFSAATSERKPRRPVPSLMMLFRRRKCGGGRPRPTKCVGGRSSHGGERTFRCFMEEEMSTEDIEGTDDDDEEEEDTHVQDREMRHVKRTRPRKYRRRGLCMLAASITAHIWGSIYRSLKHRVTVISPRRTSHKRRAATPKIEARKNQLFSDGNKTALHSFLI